MNNERGGGKAYEMGCSEKDRLCCLYKKKIGSYKNLWPKRHLLGFEKIFNNVSVQTVNFSEKVLFINLR